MNLAQKFEQRGREEGQHTTLRTLLPQLMKLRFGPLAQPTLDRIAAADLGTLQRWADQVMEAPTLDDLFGG